MTVMYTSKIHCNNNNNINIVLVFIEKTRFFNISFDTSDMQVVIPKQNIARKNKINAPISHSPHSDTF